MYIVKSLKSKRAEYKFGVMFVDLRQMEGPDWSGIISN